MKIRKMDTKKLKNEIKWRKDIIKKERAKSKIKTNWDKVLGLEAQKSDIEMQIAIRKNNEYLKRKTVKELLSKAKEEKDKIQIKRLK